MIKKAFTGKIKVIKQSDEDLNIEKFSKIKVKINKK